MGRQKHLKRAALFVAALLLLAAVAAAAVWWYYRLERYLERLGVMDAVTFSIEGAFAQPGQSLALRLPEQLGAFTEVYYTMDGSTPNSSSTLYSSPILLDPLPQRGCWTIKAIVVQGEASSRVYTRSYFPTDTAVLSPDIYIVSLSGEPDDFYGQQHGILALGAEDQEAAMADEALPMNRTLDARGNFYGHGREWERPVTVEIFDSAGQRILYQQAGVRVSGGSTREYEQKSLRLYARREYDPLHGKFSASVLGPLYGCDPAETPIKSFNHLDLRNGGNDFYGTMLNDATARMLAADAGPAPVAQARPAVVYLNGEYYGLAWMMPQYNEKDLAEMCNLQNETQIQILEEGEGAAYSALFPEAHEQYLDMYDVAMKDLTVAANAQALEEMVDIDNFLLYSAWEMYCNNQDWPHNNYKIWRYVDASEDERQSNPQADGRWRFLLYDLDFAFGTIVEGAEGFEWALGVEASPMLVSVLRNEDFRNRFVNIWCCLLATALQPSRAGEIVTAAQSMIEPEMLYREQQDPEQLMFDANYRQVLLTKLDRFLLQRPAEIHAGLKTYCEAAGSYTLRIESPQTGGTVNMNGFSLAGGQQLQGIFYRSAPAEFSFAAAQGYALQGWEINGKLIRVQHLVLDSLGEEERVVTVRPVVERVAGPLPLLSAISYQNERNWIELTNYGDAPVQLEGMNLTRSTDGEGKSYSLPDITLAKGESVRIYQGNSDFSATDIGSYMGAFKFREQDTLYLWDSGGTLLDSLTLPANQKNCLYARDDCSPFWKWYTLEEDSS